MIQGPLAPPGQLGWLVSAVQLAQLGPLEQRDLQDCLVTPVLLVRQEGVVWSDLWVLTGPQV